MIIVLNGPAGSGKDTVGDMLVEHHGYVKIAFADEVKRICMRLWDFSEEQLWGDLKDVPDKRYPFTPKHIQALEHHVGMMGHDLEVMRQIEEEVAQHKKNPQFLTPRYAMQMVGTEGARAADPDVWLRIALKAAKELLTPLIGSVEAGTPCFPVYFRTKGVVTQPFTHVETKGIAITDGRFLNELEGVSAVDGQTARLIGRAYEWTKTSQHASEAAQREIPDDYFDFLLHNKDIPLHELKLRVDSMMAAINGRMMDYNPDANNDIPPFKRV